MSTATDLSIFSGISLFDNLTLEELSDLSQKLHRQTFPTGSCIFSSQQPGEAIYIILEGTIKVYLERSEGGSVTLAILSTGEVLGEMSTIDSEMRSASAVTLEESTLLWMDNQSFNQCL